jgi:two-component system, OmpR family, alkaline phosphatase synthesis response regulator PhoP
MNPKNRKVILAIDDDITICRLLELELASEGFYVSTCSDGKEGLRRVKNELPDLVLLDLDLPGLSGEAVCKELKKDSATENIPVIMLTGKDTDADKVIGKVIGASFYIPKPFDKHQLLEKIHSCLG